MQIQNLLFIFLTLSQVNCKQHNSENQVQPKDTTNNALLYYLEHPVFKPVNMPVSYASPTIAHLIVSDSLTIKAFWDSISKVGTPMIETIKDDPDASIITFLDRQKKDDLDLTIGFRSIREDTSFGDMRLRHIPKTDVWYRSYKVPKEITIAYRFFYTENNVEVRFLDPLNHYYVPTKLRNGADNYNVYHCFLDSTKAWFYERPEVPKGSLDTFQVFSKVLNNSHGISVYLPDGYDKTKSYPVMVLFDAVGYLEVIPTPTILDNLIYAKQIPPMVAVLVDTRVNRTQELSCYKPFADFIATELMPLMHQKYSITTNPGKSIIAGSSLGGLASGYIAYNYPNVFGNVLSQAGSYWLNNGYLINEYAISPRLSITYYLDCGLLEGNIYGNRDMYNLLKTKGYKTYYQEYQGYHDKTWWRKTLSDGLIALCKEMK